MSYNASYITSSSKHKTLKKNPLSVLLLSFFAMAIALTTIAGGVSTHNAKKAEAFDWSQWIMCSVLPEPADMIYQITQTSDLQFMARSKSAMAFSADSVDSSFNWLLEVSGMDFKEINKTITGYDSDKPEIDEALTEKEYEARYNQGSYVNPFDRFGMAGMKFTGYMGEWKYFVVDACATGGEPKDPQAGLFYENRLEPRSTWDDRTNSPDVRTQQFNKGIVVQFLSTIGNTLANWIFSITKIIVSVTLAFINFAFTDISEVLGLTKLIGGDGGVFQSLYKGIFLPLVLLAFVLTGIHLFYTGIVKRQYRTALSSVLRSVLLFFIAIIVGTNSLFFIAIPNNIAVVVQSVILVSMNSSITGGDQICATDVGQINNDPVEENIVADKDESPNDILTQASKTIRSVVGCQMWQSLLLKPWSEGQFGTDWNNLWANDKVAKWADSTTSGTLGNSNESMVGEAEVPLGGGKVINNWAIYQISAQTYAHAPTGRPGQKPKFTGGVSNDWWRIVDATSNYQEKNKDEVIETEGENITVSYQIPAGEPTTSAWTAWVGNNIFTRIGAATTSVLVAGISVAAPLLFAALSLIYTLGLAILMAFAPLMLLFGCWAPKGWEIFKGWGELVLNTMMKRIATGLLLTISILFISSIMKLSDTVSWWQTMAGLMMMAILLIKVRRPIIDALASFKFASTNFAGTVSRMTDAAKRRGVDPIKTGGKVVGSAVVGGTASSMNGGSFAKGMFAGAGKEFKNVAYSNQGLREVITSYEAEDANRGGDLLQNSTACAICGKKLDYEAEQNGTSVFHGGRDRNGNLICNECMMDGVDPDSREVTFYRSSAKDRATRKRNKSQRQLKMYSAFQDRFKKNSVFNNGKNRAKVDAIATGSYDNGAPLTTKDKEDELILLLRGTQLDISDHSLSARARGDSALAETPEIPAEIAKYVDPDILNQAWSEQRYDYIRMTYIAGYALWFEDVTGTKLSQKLDEVLETIKTTSTPGNTVEPERDKKGRGK